MVLVETVRVKFEPVKSADPPRSSAIACRTLIGKGSPNKEGTKAPHGSPLGADEIVATRAALDWPYPAFEMPDDVLGACHHACGAPPHVGSDI